MELVVARIGAPRGLRGDVRLEIRTDDPAGRLAPGAVLTTDPADAGPLTVATCTEQGGTWHVRFVEAADRTAVEELRGVLLLAEAEPEDDAWYRHELVGLAVQDTAGRAIGTVAALEHYPAQDVLVVTETGGQRTLVPFVAEIVPVVDVAGGRVVLDPPRGLLAADED
ncbi:ribosome maturation factor RimM [Georgenia sunbinii]|uniref:ribosome maturation factor RimM n=1 Tax=Georgenia sunbinii TaxID=3117728 RepID=UPI002F26CBDF